MSFLRPKTVPAIDRYLDELLDEAFRIGEKGINPQGFFRLMHGNVAVQLSPEAKPHIEKVAELKEAVKNLEELVARIERRRQDRNLFLNFFRVIRRYFTNIRIRSLSKRRAREEAKIKTIEDDIEKRSNVLQYRVEHEIAVARKVREEAEKRNGKVLKD